MIEGTAPRTLAQIKLWKRTVKSLHEYVATTGVFLSLELPSPSVECVAPAVCYSFAMKQNQPFLSRPWAHLDTNV